MACNDETTVLEQRVASGINSDSTSLRSDETNLYKHIDKEKIFGLNLSQPQEGSKCIKPWDQKGDMSTWTESGVDDQVSVCRTNAKRKGWLFLSSYLFASLFVRDLLTLSTYPSFLTLEPPVHHHDPLYSLCQGEIDLAEPR